MNLVPSLVSLSKIIEPSNDSIIRFTMAKSKPCPLDFEVNVGREQFIFLFMLNAENT
jgi:hypothetical protein